MARVIVGNNQEYEFEDVDKAGNPVIKKAGIDYSAWHHETTHWNTNDIPNPDNPYWGNIWVLNWRSKDDVCHIYRTATWLQYLREFAKDKEIQEVAAETWYYMQGWTRDIVDTLNPDGNGYNIRSKDKDGKALVPWGDKADLACFTCFDWIDKNSECTARISTSLLAYGSKLKNSCGEGFGGVYEEVATGQHYYEYAIFRQFHVSAVMNSILNREDKAASTLLKGLAKRIDDDFAAPESKYQQHVKKAEWERDIAMTALTGASGGLPLTWKEARLLHYYYSNSIDEFGKWTNWDIWSLPDGTYGYRPGADPNRMIDEEDMAFFIEFCWSPFRNKATVLPVDCDIIKDPAKW
jgi:hypothetical protein